MKNLAEGAGVSTQVWELRLCASLDSSLTLRMTRGGSIPLSPCHPERAARRSEGSSEWKRAQGR